MTTIIPTTHPGNPSDAITSVWLSILYILAVTAFGWYMILSVWLFLSYDLEDPEPTPVTDIIPYDIAGILSGSLVSLGTFAFLMFCLILPLQSPGWWALWRTSRKLRSLPETISLPSLRVLKGIIRTAAVAYLWAIIGFAVAVCGFKIHLALLNPQFTWIQPENTGIGDILSMIGQALRLLAAIACIQLPGWLGLWFFNRPIPTPPMPNDPRWQRWRKGAVIYLKWSAVITVMIMALRSGVFLYDEFLAPGDVFKILDMNITKLLALAFFSLFILSGAILYAMFIVFLIQLPGWLVMAWLERWRRQAAGIPRSHTGLLRLLQGAAIGYLAMIMAAWVTWWFYLGYVNNLDSENIFPPHLAPVLDVLLWAQIPGWIAFALWFILWLNQTRKHPAL